MPKVAIPDAKRFMTECLKAVGASSKAAEQQAMLLLQADRYGHHSHGLNRLEYYIRDIACGVCTPNEEPQILKETVATAWVDAKNVLGATSGHFGMDLAIKKAKAAGIGWVSVKGANHFGMAGYWAQIAAEEGFIGMAFTNTSPFMVPTRSKQAALGTNPIAVVAPGDGEELYVDMATTAVAVGKIEIQQRKEEPIPDGWALDPDGNITNDADLGFKSGRLMPLGGAEQTSGYKGYGLGAVVELFCGILAGSKYGHHIRAWANTPSEAADLGHCFVALNPACFAPGFGCRLTEMIHHWRQLPAVDPNLPVLAPGDKEKAAYKDSESSGIITYVEQQIFASAALAEKLKVQPMKVLDDKDINLYK